MIKKYFIKTATTHRHDRKQLENFHYDVIYHLLKEPTSDQTHTKLRQLKAKIVRLYTAPQHRRCVDTADTDVLEGESLSLYHLIRQRRRQTTRLVDNIQDVEGTIKNAPFDILRVFTICGTAK
jgi:hypothetical protein